MLLRLFSFFFFFFNDTATTEIYTLSLHDALPISRVRGAGPALEAALGAPGAAAMAGHRTGRSEEHTSELQSPCNLVCRLLLEKKKKNIIKNITRAALSVVLILVPRCDQAPLCLEL